MQCIFLWVTAIIFVTNLQWIYVNAEKACPYNNITGTFGEKIFSLHTELKFQYKAATDHCHQNNGILWSETNEEEMIFLTKFYAKTRSFWVGAYKNEVSNTENCLEIQLSDNEAHRRLCTCQSYSICKYSADTCENRTPGGECYHISYKEESMANATETCKHLGNGGKLVEIRSDEDLRFYQNAIRNSKAFENMTITELQRIVKFPAIWTSKKSSSDAYKYCHIFRLSQVQRYPCTGKQGFVCKYQEYRHSTSPDASVPQTANSIQNSSTATATLLDDTERTIENEPKTMATSTKQLPIQKLYKLETSVPTKAKIPASTSVDLRNRYPKSAEQIINNSEYEQETTIADKIILFHEQNLKNEHIEPARDIKVTQLPKTSEISASTKQNGMEALPLLLSAESANYKVLENGTTIQGNHYLIPTAIVTTAMSIGFILTIGIIVIIILLIQKSRRKGNLSNNESNYLEPKNPTSKSAGPVRRKLPTTPTGTNILYCKYAELNDNEYEPLHIPDSEDPMQHQYIYID